LALSLSPKSNGTRIHAFGGAQAAAQTFFLNTFFNNPADSTLFVKHFFPIVIAIDGRENGRKTNKIAENGGDGGRGEASKKRLLLAWQHGTTVCMKNMRIF
jgi:hypothetical protein